MEYTLTGMMEFVGFDFFEQQSTVGWIGSLVVWLVGWKGIICGRLEESEKLKGKLRMSRVKTKWNMEQHARAYVVL